MVSSSEFSGYKGIPAMRKMTIIGTKNKTGAGKRCGRYGVNLGDRKMFQKYTKTHAICGNLTSLAGQRWTKSRRKHSLWSREDK